MSFDKWKINDSYTPFEIGFRVCGFLWGSKICYVVGLFLFFLLDALDCHGRSRSVVHHISWVVNDCQIAFWSVCVCLCALCFVLMIIIIVIMVIEHQLGWPLAVVNCMFSEYNTYIYYIYVIHLALASLWIRARGMELYSDVIADCQVPIDILSCVAANVISIIMVAVRTCQIYALWAWNVCINMVYWPYIGMPSEWKWMMCGV